MNKEEAIYIGWWMVDGQRVFAVTPGTSFQTELDSLRKAYGNRSNKVIDFIHNRMRKSVLFADYQSAKVNADILHSRMETKYGVVDLGDFQAPPPDYVIEFYNAAVKQVTITPTINLTTNVVPKKFWAIVEQDAVGNIVNFNGGSSFASLNDAKEYAQSKIKDYIYGETQLCIMECVGVVEGRINVVTSYVEPF